jgi:iron complex transport system substrate-binding protein
MRVVSLLASGTEIVCALGAADSLVGRSHECDNPEWVQVLPSCTRPAFDTTLSSRQIDEEVRRRLKDKEPLFHVDTHKIQKLEPDLLITQEHCEVCAVTPADVEKAACSAFGAQILALQAGTLAGIYEGIINVATAIRRVQAGHDLIAAMQHRLEQIHVAVASHRRPTIVMLEWTEPVFAMGNWGPELVEVANGELLLGESGKHSRAIDWIEVCRADPEYLIIAPCGYSLPRALQEIPVMERYPGWSELRAVREGKVVFADGNLYFNRSGITVVETAEIIADVVHGTRFHQQPRALAWQLLSRST